MFYIDKTLGHASAAQWFVDGRDLFASIAKTIQKAKHEIYITDWLMCVDTILYVYTGLVRT